MEEEQLIECPFCNNTTTTMAYDRVADIYYTICDCCGAVVHFNNHTKDGTIKSYNSRPTVSLKTQKKSRKEAVKDECDKG